jgi:hypothetical protein
MMPLGEGFDELWHFIYIQRVAELGKPPESHATQLSSEGLRFLQLHPVAWAVHNNFPAMPSYEEYWRSNPKNRYLLDEQLSRLRFAGHNSEITNAASAQYESHQPPLYYYLSAPMFSLFSSRLSFVHTFTAMRMFSVLLASLIMPALFFIARDVLRDSNGAANAVAVLVLFPGLYPSVTHVSNDALVLPLAGWTLFCLVRFLERSTPSRLFALQTFLIAGLWTKALFLPIVAGVILTLIYAGHFRAAAIVVAFSTLGTPWYIHNFIQSHTITGLPEISGTTSTITAAQALSKLNWLNFFRVLRSSHIWTGNWSFLSVRIWMYQVVSTVYFLGIVGLLRGRLQNSRAIVALGICYSVFIIALVYHATIEFRYNGASVTLGWFLAPMIPAEIVLFVAGMQSLLGRRQRWAFAFSQTALMLFLVYTAAFIEAPYYAGITAHVSNGPVATYHPHVSDMRLMSERLFRFNHFVPQNLPWVLLSAFVFFAIYSTLGNIAGWDGQFRSGSNQTLQ